MRTVADMTDATNLTGEIDSAPFRIYEHSAVSPVSEILLFMHHIDALAGMRRHLYFFLLALLLVHVDNVVSVIVTLISLAAVAPSARREVDVADAAERVERDVADELDLVSLLALL